MRDIIIIALIVLVIFLLFIVNTDFVRFPLIGL